VALRLGSSNSLPSHVMYITSVHYITLHYITLHYITLLELAAVSQQFEEYRHQGPVGQARDRAQLVQDHLYSTLQYSIVQYSTVQYVTVQYSTIP
jgi:hypothetical protein